MRTKDLDTLVEKCVKKKGGRPAFKGYKPGRSLGQGFPASACISVNDGIVHGLPSSYKLKSGDIVSIDIGVECNGYYADAAKTFPVGKSSEEALRLVGTCEIALFAAVEQCVSGNHLSDISHTIQTIAERAGYSVVRDYVGHGIGRSMHESPQIPNYGESGRGPVLKEGMAFALEPMINAGGCETKVLPDGWSVATADGSLSAHFEHTVAVSDKEPLVLTAFSFPLKSRRERVLL